jgi:prepilin-type N-terminal cleavage/methylation domain-containing protein
VVKVQRAAAICIIHRKVFSLNSKILHLGRVKYLSVYFGNIGKRYRVSEIDFLHGYSLVELLMVITLGATILTIAIPNIVRLHQEWTLWGSIRLLEGSMRWGRMHAIAANAPMIFMISEDRGKFYWADPESGVPFEGSIRHLPHQVRIIACPRSPLRFYQHGNAAPAGTFTIEGAAGAYSLIVAPGGRIRLAKE